MTQIFGKNSRAASLMTRCNFQFIQGRGHHSRVDSVATRAMHGGIKNSRYFSSRTRQSKEDTSSLDEAREASIVKATRYRNKPLILESGGLSNPRIQRNMLFLSISFGGLCYILTQLPGLPDPSSYEVVGLWKYAVVGTHALTFLMFPWIMRIFYEALPAMKFDRGAVFASQLGLAFIMVSIAAEMGWHVTQHWYYTNGFTMLNFMFYFFKISGFSLWADSLVKDNSPTTQITNVIFALLLLASSVLYPLGYAADDPSYKIPIFITLAVTLGVLTYRGYRVLEDRRIFWFPALSVGVNMFFIGLLNSYGQGSAEFNALFHILHDLCGTFAGVGVFAYLVYTKIPIDDAIETEADFDSDIKN